jgi:hypothetical protein
MRTAVVWASAALLAACGGGGGGSGPAPPSYSVTATAQNGGAIAPATATLAAGGTATFTITPAPGYVLASISGCGGSVAGNTYTIAGVTADCAITATFTALKLNVSVRGNALGGLALENNGENRIAVDSDGNFTFTSGIALGAPYSVSVAKQPVAHVCRVTNGEGVISASTAPVEVHCVNRVVANSPLTLRTGVDGAGHFEQTLYFRLYPSGRPVELHQFRVHATHGGLEDIAPAWSLGPYFSTFSFAANGARVFAENGLGTVVGASVREADGAVIPAWTALFGNYSIALPTPLTPVRPSHDGRMLYRNVTPIVSGFRYDDFWVGTVDDTGVSVLSGAPFAIGSDVGAPTVDPTDRYVARLLRGQGRIEIYRAFSASVLQPERLHELPSSIASSIVTFLTEDAPGRYLYEANRVSGTGSARPAPQVTVYALGDDGSLTALGGPLEGVATTGEIAAEVCVFGATNTSRASSITLLPSNTARTSRYLIQRQDTSCLGSLLEIGIKDTRLLGVHFLSVSNGQFALTTLPLEARAEWTDLGAGGWAHPSKPWLYIGSKHSERIYGYSVDEATATVQPLPGSPFAVGSAPPADGLSVPALVMDPAERFLFIARSSLTVAPSTYVAAFGIDASTGALTHVGTYIR